MTDLSAPTQLALLLMARWASKDTHPLTNTEFGSFFRWMSDHKIQSHQILDRQADLSASPVDPERLERLLGRTFGVFQNVDKWINAGLWIRSWSDPGYPSRFKTLKHRAPIVLFGYGDANAFTSRALAIVGSRNASEERLHKAREIGRACAAKEVTVVSGGAKGIDSAAMSSGAVGNGTVVGIVADSLLRASSNAEYRQAIQEKRMCLMSEPHPEAKFDVGMAMARNRLAYACADAALVIESDVNSGGTWAGALEALRIGSHVYVLKGARAEEALVQRGAVAVDVEFALDPMSLVEGKRPHLVEVRHPSCVDAYVRTLLCTHPSPDLLADHFRSCADKVATQLSFAAMEDGWKPTEAPQTETPPPSSKAKKGRTKRKKEETPALFVSEDIAEYEQEPRS